MFSENVMSGLGWLPLISRIVWAKTPQNPRDVAALNFIFITVFVSGRVGMTISRSTLALARSAKNINGRQ